MELGAMDAPSTPQAQGSTPVYAIPWSWSTERLRSPCHNPSSEITKTTKTRGGKSLQLGLEFLLDRQTVAQTTGLIKYTNILSENDANPFFDIIIVSARRK